MTDPFWFEDRGSSMIRGITDDIRTRRGKSLESYPRGNPNPRWAMMLRCTSEVPAAIVLLTALR